MIAAVLITLLYILIGIALGVANIYFGGNTDDEEARAISALLVLIWPFMVLIGIVTLPVIGLMVFFKRIQRRIK